MKTFGQAKQIYANLILMIAGSCMLFTSCKTYQILNSDTDSTADFSAYHSYAWLADKDNEKTAYHNSIIHNNIKNYFSHHFAAFGYQPDTEAPDLLFEQVITSENKTRTGSYSEQHPAPAAPNYNYQNNRYYTPNPNPNNYNYSNNYNYNYNNRNYNNNYGYTSNPNYYNNNTYYAQQYKTETHTYTEKYATSTFTLNAIDRKTNKLVWTCTVQADIYDGLGIESDVHPAVHTMLKTFPAKKLKRSQYSPVN